MESTNLVGVTLVLDRNSWHGTDSEGVWVRLVQSTATKGIVVVDNIPFFTKSISLEDKISVVFDGDKVMFDAVIERGGHSTYRLFAESPGEDFAELLKDLASMGCSWEKTIFNDGELYAIDVPPEVNLSDAYSKLEFAKQKGICLFEEGFVGHPLDDRPASVQ